MIDLGHIILVTFIKIYEKQLLMKKKCSNWKILLFLSQLYKLVFLWFHCFFSGTRVSPVKVEALYCFSKLLNGFSKSLNILKLHEG